MSDLEVIKKEFENLNEVIENRENYQDRELERIEDRVENYGVDVSNHLAYFKIKINQIDVATMSIGVLLLGLTLMTMVFGIRGWMFVKQTAKDVEAMQEQLIEINQNIDEMEIRVEEMQNEIVVEIENAKSEIIADNYGTFKSFMYYTSLSSSSKQGQIQKSATTDSNGLRKIGDMYIIATGSYYGNVGDILEVTLSNGNSFLAVKGDMKADKDTDENNQVCIHDGSVIEFIVDKDKLNPSIKKLGDVSALDYFKGSITKIEVLTNEI